MKITFLCFIVLCLSQVLSAQIRLPAGFKCKGGGAFSDGVYSFTSYAWGRDGISGRDVVNTIESNWGHKVSFQRTKDGLYWASGYVNGSYVYTVLVDGVYQYSVRSQSNGSQFGNYSSWLLQELRNNKRSGRSSYYIDNRGRSCN